MRILHITPYITSQKHPAFMRNQTGFGYMVHDIAKYTSKLAEVDLLAVMCITPEMTLDGFKVIGRSWLKLLRNISRTTISDGLSFFAKYHLPLKDRLRAMYVYLSMGQLNKIVADYDIVHIHGCSVITDAAINVCKKKNVPFLVTLHGLNSFSDSIGQNASLKRYERDFLKAAAINHYPVSFISTGNMKTAAESTGVSVESFHVICNGCDVNPKYSDLDVRKIYGLSEDDFVFAFVGNVSENKNQLQVARAWMLLPDDIKSRCKVLFVGRYNSGDELVQFIEANNMQKNLILCGMQPKEKIASFYQACNATILTSITEGFGLSIIEGFVYGKPNVTFADLPATNDLYKSNAMVLAKDRSDEALADAMAEVMKRIFDITSIENHAKKFSFESMAEKYINLYKKIAK